MKKQVRYIFFYLVFALGIQSPLHAFWSINPQSLVQKNEFLQEISKPDADLNVIQDLFYANPGLANTTFSQGITPLHIAAKMGNLDLIDFLISRGARVNQRTLTAFDRGTGMTPLHYAALAGKADAIKALIQRGAVVNWIMPPGVVPPDSFFAKTALEFAAQSGDLKTVETLIDRGAWVKQTWGYPNNKNVTIGIAIMLLSPSIGMVTTAATKNLIPQILGMHGLLIW